MNHLTPGSTVTTPAPQDGATNPPYTTLAPLRDQGPDALAPRPADLVRHARLLQFTLRWLDLPHEQEIITAPSIYDLPRADAAAEELIPKGARLIEALFACWPPASSEPCLIRIHPPRRLAAEPAHALPLANAWTGQHQFLLARPAALLLAIASLLLPEPGDDTDDDDPDTPPPTARLRASRY